jgi:hypothetical protein
MGSSSGMEPSAAAGILKKRLIEGIFDNEWDGIYDIFSQNVIPF